MHFALVFSTLFFQNNTTRENSGGKVKEVSGDITGNSKEKMSGLVDQVVGKTKKVASNAKDVAEEVADKAKK